MYLRSMNSDETREKEVDHQSFVPAKKPEKLWKCARDKSAL